VNKAVIIGIAVSGTIIGILVVLSLDSFSILEDDDVSEPILVIEEEETKNESKPQGRNFSIELDEKMGLSAP
jgi:hypothetical protein